MSDPRRAADQRLTRADVLAPLFWAIFRATTLEQLDWRYPHGPAAVTVEGSSPVRILVLGDGPAAGCGVRTHDEGIAGFLAREVAEATGRGVHVRVLAEPTASARSTVDRVSGADLSGHDAIVLMLAATDALCLTARRSWQRHMTALVEALSAQTGCLVVTSVGSLDLTPALSPLARRVAGRHARLLNTVTSLVCARSAVPMVSLDAASELTAGTYARWASRIGAVVTRSLSLTTQHP